MGYAVSENSLTDTLTRQASKTPESVAFHFEGRETTYAEFDKNTNRIANGLLGAGFQRGDHIAFLGKNSDHFFEVMYGAMKAGMIATPINYRLAAPELIYVINDAEATVLFVGPESSAISAEISSRLNNVRLTIAMETSEPEQEWPTYAQWRDSHPDTPPENVIKLDDVALQLYTSGTTGHPKGVMLSHRNLVSLIRSPEEAPDWDQWCTDDVTLITLPIFHVAGVTLAVRGLVYAVKNVVLRDFDPGAVLDAIHNHRISKCLLVPATLQFLIRHPKAAQTDYSSLEYMVYGGSAIPLHLLKECVSLFNCRFVQMYGLTETTGGVSALGPEDHTPEGSERMRSVGKALTDVEFAILDQNGNRLGAGETGEIAIRSNSNMVGYWKMPEATRDMVTKDNWLRTGDAGYMDDDGYVYIQDRIKDMIISGGENIYPAEVENAIFSHPAVSEVAVIGVPDDKWGESVRAVVVKKPDMAVTEEEIINFARACIAAYKTPKAVDFVDALPRNPSGKVLRRELREPYWQGKSRRVN